MPISQRQAKQILRAETSMSHEWCEKQVKALAIVPDGKRKKIRETALRSLIEDTLRPMATTKGIIRPISQKGRQRERELGCI